MIEIVAIVATLSHLVVDPTIKQFLTWEENRLSH